jgi:dTDP-glucose 4,6-dehydratase
MATQMVSAVNRDDLDEICKQTASLWEPIRGQNIFVTGGTGFFGCWLLESFAVANERFSLGAHLTALTRSPDVFSARYPHLASDSAISLLSGNVRDFTFPEGEFAFVIHAAADARPSHARGGPRATISTIVDGTRRTLEFASSHGTRRFLMVSSGAVYGKQPAEMDRIPESYSGGPDTCSVFSAYGEGKRLAESLCAAYSRDEALECAIARCFTFLGPYMALDPSYAIGSFLGSCLAGKPIRISGDGSTLRSYLYASDLAVWLWMLLLKGPVMQAVNVGSDEEISILALAKEVLAALDLDLPIEVAGTPVPGIVPARYVPSVQSAQGLGLRQTVSLRDAIRRTQQWHQVMGDGLSV